MSRKPADDTPPSVLFACAAQHAFIDGSGRLCLNGVLREIYVPALPYAIERLCLGLEILGTGPPPHRSTTLAIQFVRPNGTAAARDPRLNTAETVWPRLAVTIRDLIIEREGTHRFLIFIGAKQAGHLDIPIRIAAADQLSVH